MATIADLLEERAAKRSQQLDLVDRQAAESDEARSAEMEREYQKRDAELVSLSRKIDLLESEERDAKAADEKQSAAERAAKLDPSQDKRSREERLKSDEYRSAIDTYLRHGVGALTEEQRSAMAVGTDADGGYAVAELWADGLINPLRESSPIRNVATVIQTSTGGEMHFPRVATRIAGVDIVAEATAANEDAPSLDEVIVGAKKLFHIVKASEEVVQDATFNVEGFIGSELGFELGLKSGSLYSLGTGTGVSGDAQPMGIFARASSAFTAASIGYDQLVDLEHSVLSPYRSNAQWLLNDTTAATIRKLKDTNNRPLWEYGIEKNRPARLLGYEVVIDPYAPANSVGNKPIAFGNFQRGYLIRDTLGVTIRRLDERYAEVGQVAWRGTLRTSGIIRDTNAIKVFTRS